ncbi:beta-galactosidase-1-like protein 2 isoform X2 [Oratosquilla oratoria]
MTFYDYYAPGGQVSTGLVGEGDTFKLNGKEILIVSGAAHYFRIHPDYWRDTLKKLRAAGLNAVETYVAWNLHEPRQGVFDYGQLDEDMSPFLDLVSYIRMAQEEDLFVILRPGPYICSEWDFGGLPSWLLRDPTMHVRTYYEGFRNAAAKFLNDLFPRVVDLQFTRGGPIIAVQIENEYGSFGYQDNPRDKMYLRFLEENFKANGMGESLFFTSDSTTIHQDLGATKGVLQMSNFKTDGDKELSLLKKIQPNRPLMVAEYWTGWFDHWLSGVHTGFPASKFEANLKQILSFNASVNMYMFIGGTNFGFMAGANTMDVFPHYAPDVSSYDYDAPLSEAGDYTEKYFLAKDTIASFNPLAGVVSNPEPPPQRTKKAYGQVNVTGVMDFESIIKAVGVSVLLTDGPVNMEALDINDNNGQSYGYIVYRTSVPLQSDSVLKIRGHVRDAAQVMVDGTMATKPLTNVLHVNNFGWWEGRDKELKLQGEGKVAELTIMVENLGRVNFGHPHKYVQKKGLWEGPVLIDGEEILEWRATPLEFKKKFINGLRDWKNFESPLPTPALYRAVLEIEGKPQDTFLDMRTWGKGVAFVNGFNLGRYWHKGPTKTLYLPAPLLKSGANDIIIFEQNAAVSEVVFSDVPILQ